MRRLTSTRIRGLVIVATLVSCGGSEEALPARTATAASIAPPTSDAPATGGTLVLRDADCRFESGGTPIPAGPVAFQVRNATDSTGAFNIAKLDGATFAEFDAHIRQEVRLARAGEPGLGHPSFAVPSFDVVVGPGASDVLAGDVDAGSYVLSCARVYEEVGELRPVAALGPIRVA